MSAGGGDNRKDDARDQREHPEGDKRLGGNRHVEPFRGSRTKIEGCEKEQALRHQRRDPEAETHRTRGRRITCGLCRNEPADQDNHNSDNGVGYEIQRIGPSRNKVAYAFSGADSWFCAI
jgi:hypothetical protein